MRGERIVAIAGAFIGGAALLAQLYLTVGGMMADGNGLLVGVWRFFAYFTILTNIMVFAVFVGAALKGDDRRGFNDRRMELTAVASILFVAVVYHLLLASRWDPQGLQKAADIALHTITPGLFTLFWFMRRNGGLLFRDALYAALWPTAYCLYLLARGAFDGFYPYYFIDPGEVGWVRLFINAAGLSGAFVVGAAVLVALDRAFERKTEPAAT